MIPVQPQMYAMQPIVVVPAMEDPMIDGLTFYPSLVVKQKMNSFCEYICNCEEENVSCKY